MQIYFIRYKNEKEAQRVKSEEKRIYLHKVRSSKPARNGGCHVAYSPE